MKLISATSWSLQVFSKHRIFSESWNWNVIKFRFYGAPKEWTSIKSILWVFRYVKRPGFSSSKTLANIYISCYSSYYPYHRGRIVYLHVCTYIIFTKEDRFLVVKLIKAFTSNFWFYQNLGKLSRKFFT